jgi:hypothetical protein
MKSDVHEFVSEKSVLETVSESHRVTLSSEVTARLEQALRFR